jgi:hypothetical protein
LKTVIRRKRRIYGAVIRRKRRIYGDQIIR